MQHFHTSIRCTSIDFQIVLLSRPCLSNISVKLIAFCLCFSSVLVRVALETLDRLTESLDFTDYASRIIHPIVRTLDSTPELRSTSMDTLSSLVFQLGKKVTIVFPRVPFTCSYYIYYVSPCWWLHKNSISANPSPPLFITSCQTADVIDRLVAGQVFMRVDYVTVTIHLLPYPFTCSHI